MSRHWQRNSGDWKFCAACVSHTAMDPVEAQILAFIKRRMAQGADSVTREEVMQEILPKDHPDWRYRAPYKGALDALYRRNRVYAVRARDGEMRYSLDAPE